MSSFTPLAFSCISRRAASDPASGRDQQTREGLAKVLAADWAAFLLLTSMLVLSGCASIQVHLGMKVYLDKTPLASMQASLPKGPGIGPGEKSPLVVTFTGPDGKVLTTEGQGQGKVMWKDVTVTATVVTANNKGS